MVIRVVNIKRKDGSDGGMRVNEMGRGGEFVESLEEGRGIEDGRLGIVLILVWVLMGCDVGMVEIMMIMNEVELCGWRVNRWEVDNEGMMGVMDNEIDWRERD